MIRSTRSVQFRRFLNTIIDVTIFYVTIMYMNRNYNYYQNIKENLQRQLVDLASILEWLDTPDSANELEAIIIEETPDLPPQTRLELINSTIADRIDDTHRQIEDINAKLMTIQTIQNTWDESIIPVPIPRRPLRRRPTRPLRRIPIPPPPETQPDLVIDISDDDDNSPPPPPILYLPSTPPGSPPHYLPSSPINSPPNSPPRRGGLGASGATKHKKRIVKSRKSKKMQHSRKRTKRSRKNNSR
jgi:hypothetical protein